MNSHRVETTITEDGLLTLKDIPFHAGDSVEVIILARAAASGFQNGYPLRGKPVTYLDPTDAVDDQEWESLKFC